MEIGLRVVRGPDWMWGDQDGGEGNVGTVVHLGGNNGVPDETVLVYWDSGKQANYRAGYAVKYDLRVFDTAQTGVKHGTVTCDGCWEKPLIGTRWKCADCFDYDLCSACFVNDVHDKQHTFLRFDQPGGNGVPVGKRSNFVKLQSKGFFHGASVTRGRDWKWGNQDGGSGQVGMLSEVTAWSVWQRSGAKVIWPRLRSNTYRTGCQGMVDLKCETPANGPSYYPDCLAKVGAHAGANQLQVGDHVSVCLDAEVLKVMAQGHGGWIDDMAECIGKVGKIRKIDADGDVHISYGLKSWVFHPDAVTKLPSFQAGDKVRVLSDKQLVQNLQQGHGGWYESMTETLGKQGKIVEVDSDGDVVVMVGADLWLFNLAALEDMSGREATACRGETSLSGYDKLKPYGFTIHGAVDGYSRRILWSEVARSNNGPRVPAAFYLNQVKEVGGCPLLLVTDCGSENGIAASMQCVFRTNDHDELAGVKSHRYCSSPANQRIEGWWSFFRRNRSNWWINLFKDMVDYGLLGVGNALHMECLWFCFSKVLQDDLNKVKDHWNSHKISKSPYSSVHGVPDVMYFPPEYHGHEECLVSVSEQLAEDMEVHCQSEMEGNIYVEYFEYILETQGWVYPRTAGEALRLYQHIIELQNE